MRAGYFIEAVRQTAIEKAYLRPEMVVADIGAGTGFMSAGLAPLVAQVYAFDASPAMLEVARKNLASFDNVTIQQADGLDLPLPEASVDAVFANMYLHHCPDPLAAIQEMVRLLKPGGRLVITDLDAHTNTWMKDEMADVWLGLERTQVSEWFRQAGLVNVIIENTGTDCCANSEAQATPLDERLAKIGVFVAVGAQRVHGARLAVKDDYAAVAIKSAESTTASCGCGDESCCSPSSAELISIDALSITPQYPDDAGKEAPPETFSLGCGNPIAMAGLKPGEIVLDIGSGGGYDAILAARRVGPSGRVIGVDMTTEMLERARRAVAKAGLSQVEFRQGHAESMPVDDQSVDVVISNCVINLTEDKGQVFGEAFRVLKPGGRLEVSDVVTDRGLPQAMRADPANWGGCVFGALPETEYLDLVRQAGFVDLAWEATTPGGQINDVTMYSLRVSARR
jgi:ubiquinone/menaquinone biosynthesis C-methylase UbiE